MRRILKGRSEVLALSSVFTEYLAQNWPRLWSHQIHIALVGGGIGIALSLIVHGLLFDPNLESARGTLLTFVGVTQGLIVVGWFFLVLTRLKPRNLVEYTNSPLIFTAGLYSVIIMFGPLFLDISYSAEVFNFRGFMSLVGVSEITFMTLLFRFVSVSRTDKDSIRATVYIAGLFSLAILLVGLLITQIGVGTVTVCIAAACAVIAAKGRLFFCLYAGSRSSVDDALALLTIFVPGAAAAILLALIFDSSHALISEYEWNFLFHSRFLALLMENGWTWLVVAAVLTIAALWADLWGWILARFFFLPKRER
jgi:hypothetical protein